MAEPMQQVYFKTAAEWREWLQDNHNQTGGVWLLFFKKSTGKPSIEYEAAVEEALCFGWIDSIIKRLDDERYVRKFTPRKDNSNWSEINKRRAERLIQTNRMTDIGLAKIEAAKRKGQWDKPDRPPRQFDMPKAFQAALNQNSKARAYFEQLAPSHQKRYIGWIATAKRQKTREKRIKEAIERLEKGQKLGLR